MKLLEGGNVFKDAEGQPLTQRINQADVPATIAWVERITGIEFPEERWLGSTGRKATSGDLDLAVDTSEVTKDQLAALLTQVIQSEGLDPQEWVKKAGEVQRDSGAKQAETQTAEQLDVILHQVAQIERLTLFRRERFGQP